MSLQVALVGDVIPTPVGPFVPSPVTYTPALKISVNGVKVITKASCVFTAPGPVVDNVVLEAGGGAGGVPNPTITKLTYNNISVIRQGDIMTSALGNILTAVVTQTKLRSG